MSTGGIAAAIRSATEAEVERIERDADARAVEIVAEARREVAARVEAAVAREEPALRADAVRRLNQARLELRRRRAGLAVERLAAVPLEAARRLDAVANGADPERWSSALQRLAEDALGFVGPRSVVRVRARDAAALEGFAAIHRVRLEPLPDEAPAGVVVAAADGQLEVDATIPVRLERARRRLAAELAGRLGLPE